MFFTGSRERTEAFEKLVIFGPDHARKGAELKVMSSVETKSPGYFSKDLRENQDQWGDRGYGVDFIKMDDQDIGYCLGKGGMTRIKIAKASGCHLQYIGQYACIGGTQTSEKTAAPTSTGCWTRRAGSSKWTCPLGTT